MNIDPLVSAASPATIPGHPPQHASDSRVVPNLDDISGLLEKLPRRISDVIETWAETLPNQPALVEAAGAWTYAQLASAVRETRTRLVDLGVRPGDRVMLVSENCRAFVASLLAISSIDAWPVLVNARLSAREIDAIRDHCDPRLVIYTTSISPQAVEHAKRHDAIVREFGCLGTIAVGALNEQCAPEPLERDLCENVAALIYTSGTTGLPKGVMLSHRNLLFVAAVSAKMRSLGPQDRLFAVLPMSHAVGLSVVLLGALLSGATLFVAPRFDPVRALAALETEQVTVLLGAPSVFSLLLDYAKLRKLKSINLQALRIISSSGAPLQAAVKSAVESLFGMTLHNGYGVTECSPNIASTRVDCPRRDLSVGKIFPGVEVKLLGNDGTPVETGGIGELRVRGPNVMKGYYRAPEETEDAIDSEGWFNTRDLARLQDDHLFIVGRTKELIVHLGFNVYPAEVEAAISLHPAVVRCAVIGKAMPKDEEVVAFVQLAPGACLGTDELAEHAARHLAFYKRPSQIFFVGEMPLTPTGKIAKGELAKIVACDMAAATTPATR
jgi:long-chain acyl-CoA synthetase